MSKEMFISSSPHETKLAVVEDDQLVEVYYERDTDVGLVGGIYKGRVSRVLPGMQSAFVDIGLERDAFLYVSDFFFEDQEDYDKILEEAEACAVDFTVEQARAAVDATPPAEAANKEATPQMAAPVPAISQVPSGAAPARAPLESQPVEIIPPETTVTPAAGATPAASISPGPTGEAHERSHFEPRGRRWRHRGQRFGEHRQGEHKFIPRQESSAPPAFQILPGESLAKYSHAVPESPGLAFEEGIPAEQETVEAEALEQAEGGGAAEIGPAESESLEPSSAEASSSATDQPEIEFPPESTVGDELYPAPPTASERLDPSAEAETVEESARVIPPAPSVASQGEPVVGPTERAKPSATPVAEVHTATERQGAEPGPVAPETGQAFAEPRIVEAEATPQTPETPPVEPADEFATAESDVEALNETASPSDERRAGGTAELASVGESTEEALAEPGQETDQPSETIPEPAAPVVDEETRVPQEPAPVQAGTAETPGAPSEGTYTLREPHQRPRFAPRRGRRGRRGTGYQGRSEAKRESRPGNDQPVQISKLLKEGQEILVQISKEPLGTKGARITSHIALPGRYLVYMPTVDHIGVSRKIVSEEERLRLRNIILEHKGPLTGGFIVRTAGQGRPEEELKADLKFLSTLWNEIRSKTERVKAPALIHRDLDLVQRVLRDTLTPDFKCVRVDHEIQYERVLDFVNRSQPSLLGKVKLYTRETPLFEEFGIQAEIEKALKPKVWLKFGGYIVINQTEALVAIDVNTGKYVGKTNRLEDTILKTNVDAVNEIVRQIRLRDLGGIIVVDFIDMDERKNRAKVTQALEEALRSDRAPTKVIAFHDFGLVAITRKRVKQSLERTLCERCGYCSGSGWVKSATTVCYEILAEARKMASQIEGKVMTLRVNPEVAKALKSCEGALVSELESLTHKDVIIKSDPAVNQERFEIF
ncbi:MAG: Rne/Rng family ribonuclease [Terriglobia bacterium]|jgi:ribonuclease G